MDDADNDDDDESEEEPDYHDACITQQEWDALFNEDNDDKIYIDKYYSFAIFIINL